MQQGQPLSLTVVVPAWNEADRLPATLDRLVAWLEDSGLTWEVIVVSDGSDDGTDDLVRSRSDDRVRLMRHEHRRGKGAAVRTGVLAATGARVLFTDADLATPIEDHAKLDDALDDGADVAIASRRMDDSEITLDQGGIRRWMGRLFPSLMRAATGLPYQDTQCGFKLFTCRAARRLFEPLGDEGFAFDVEVLCRAREEELRVDEVPVRWESRAGSKVSSVGDPLKMTGALLRLGGRGDLPAVVDHQRTVAAGWGTALVVVVLLAVLLLTRSGTPTDVLAFALLPAVVFLIGRELDGPATGALAALLTSVSALTLACALPPTTALFPALVAHAVLAAYLVGRHKASWWILMFLLLGVSVRAGGIHTFVLAAVGPIALTVLVGAGGAWKRKETAIGVGLLVLLTAAVLLAADDARSILLPAPCTDAYGLPDGSLLSTPLLMYAAGILPALLLAFAPGWRRASRGAGWRLALILWSVLPAFVAISAYQVHPCNLVGAVGGVMVVLAANARAGRLGPVGALALLLPAVGALGLAAGSLAHASSWLAAAPWIGAGTLLACLALLAGLRLGSVAVILLLLAVATLLAVGAVHAAGWIPLGA